MRWPATMALLSLTVSCTSLAACSSAPEEPILQQFFRASRLNDNTSLAGFATTKFSPPTDGTIASFDIVSVSPERREPLKLITLAKEYDAVRADETEFTRRKDAYYLENQEAVTRVLKAESVKASIGGKDAEIQAAWSKLREESAELSRKVSDAQRKLKAERVLVELSLEDPTDAADATKRDGDMVLKEVTIAAPVRRPDGSAADRTLIVSMQRVVLKGEPEVAGKWIITGVGDASASPETKTSSLGACAVVLGAVVLGAVVLGAVVLSAVVTRGCSRNATATRKQAASGRPQHVARSPQHPARSPQPPAPST